MNDPETTDLPELRSALLSKDDLDTLMRDLQECAQIDSIRQKGAGGGAANEDALSLNEARQRLLDGVASAVQIRYRHEGRQYIDTLTRCDGGIRLVRM